MPCLLLGISKNNDQDGSNNFLPWILNPTATAASISAPATNGVDHLNNMEQVTLYNPISGTYIANINGFSIPLGPQKYYLLYEFIKDEITITYPIGGEGISPKTMEYINWDAIGNNGFFKIEYSVDSGNTWNHSHCRSTPQYVLSNPCLAVHLFS